MFNEGGLSDKQDKQDKRAHCFQGKKNEGGDAKLKQKKKGKILLYSDTHNKKISRNFVEKKANRKELKKMNTQHGNAGVWVWLQKVFSDFGGRKPVPQ